MVYLEWLARRMWGASRTELIGARQRMAGSSMTARMTTASTAQAPKPHQADLHQDDDGADHSVEPNPHLTEEHHDEQGIDGRDTTGWSTGSERTTARKTTRPTTPRRPSQAHNAIAPET